MKKGSRIKSILKWLNHYFVFFLLVAFVITCCTMLFVSTLANTLDITLSEDDIGAAATITFWNVALLS
ncbi:MAG: sensor histidine kinase, partial [Clostridia bacterium]|nr:sensor histidine kinase [Clostridia bacterium]